MSVKCFIIKKLQQLTCDKVELNRKFLKWHKCLKEAEKCLDGSGHKKK